MSIRVEEPKSPWAKILRAPVYGPKHREWCYKPLSHDLPKDAEAARALLKKFHSDPDFHFHPGNVDWTGILPYSGAVCGAMKAVDRAVVSTTYPEGPKQAPVEYEYPLSRGGQLLKTGICFAGLMAGLPIPSVGVIMGVPLEFHEAFVYLGLNALRNFAADLSAKHSIGEWGNFLHHVKWNKMTDSMLVTSLGYVILSSLIAALRPIVGEDAARFVIPVILTLLDGALQIITRLIRGFPVEVAKYDFFRPLIGDLGAAAAFGFIDTDIGSHAFAYLMLRKVFSESWSGIIEARSKTKEKITQRYNDFISVLDLDQYKVPDPAAVAAINLAYLAKVKSLSPGVIDEIVASGCIGRIDKNDFSGWGYVERWGILRALRQGGYLGRYGIIGPNFGERDRFRLDGFILNQLIVLRESEKNKIFDVLTNRVCQEKSKVLIRIISIYAAMIDDERIEHAAASIFPGDEWAKYKEEMLRQFRINRVDC